jgi:carboxynorspermidine decarboxylase
MVLDTTLAPSPLTSAQPASLSEAFRRSGLETPSYVFDHERFHRNGRILKDIQDRTGARILLAQKAFSCHALYPTLRHYLAGTTASGLHEALLGHEYFGGEVHVFSPAYKEKEMDELLEIADHLVFNSLTQWNTFRDRVLSAPRPVSAGLRVNPEHSSASTPMYDPCAPGSRFGIRAETLADADLTGIEGFHFHVLCQQYHDALERALAVVEERFARWLPQLSWLNLGGGHLLTSPEYDVDHLCGFLDAFSRRHPNLTLYLEPGEAVAHRGGVLVGTVLDILENGMQVAVLDVSATCHMPDVLEMPYRPPVQGSGLPGEKPFTYRFGGPTCLSGDVIGDYSFDRPLQIGDQVVFEDQAFYTVVKNTTFNGINLPSLSVFQNGAVHLIKEFGYNDFVDRLG